MPHLDTLPHPFDGVSGPHGNVALEFVPQIRPSSVKLDMVPPWRRGVRCAPRRSRSSLSRRCIRRTAPSAACATHINACLTVKHLRVLAALGRPTPGSLQANAFCRHNLVGLSQSGLSCGRVRASVRVRGFSARHKRRPIGARAAPERRATGIRAAAPEQHSSSARAAPAPKRRLSSAGAAPGPRPSVAGAARGARVTGGRLRSDARNTESCSPGDTQSAPGCPPRRILAGSPPHCTTARTPCRAVWRRPCTASRRGYARTPRGRRLRRPPQHGRAPRHPTQRRGRRWRRARRSSRIGVWAAGRAQGRRRRRAASLQAGPCALEPGVARRSQRARTTP